MQAAASTLYIPYHDVSLYIYFKDHVWKYFVWDNVLYYFVSNICIIYQLPIHNYMILKRENMKSQNTATVKCKHSIAAGNSFIHYCNIQLLLMTTY